MAMPPLVGGYMALSAPTSHTDLQSDGLSCFYDIAGDVPATTSESLAVNPLALSHAPSTTTTISGYTTASTIEAYPRDLLFSPTAEPLSSSPIKSPCSRASMSSKSSGPVPASPRAPKRRARRAASEGGSCRDKSLERNRIAARNCRQRKKEWVSNLEEAKSRLESQNSQLKVQYNGLLREVNHMKNEIMAHGSCGDPTVDKWINKEARRLVSMLHGGQAWGAVSYGGPLDSWVRPSRVDYQFDEGELILGDC